MGLVLVTPPTAEPVSLAEAKAFSRVDHDWENDLLTSLVSAARIAAETETGRQIVTAAWQLTLDAWPDGCEITLPRPALQSVQSVTYYDPDGTQQTFSSSDYWTSIAGVKGRIVLKPSASWPDLEEGRPDAIQINFLSGYGDPSSVPDGLKTAIGLLVGHWYEHREAVVEGTITALRPLGWKFLIQNYNAGKI
jgi:uncharacterized phiE125 gp8 family phage protein